MGLSISEIIEILKNPKKTQVISKAIQHENHIRFHVESAIEQSEISQRLTIFLEWVSTLIPKDKFNIFVSLFILPTPIISLTDIIFKELERVFDGKKPVFNYQFEDHKYAEDWEEYRKTELKEPIVWRKKGWDAVKTRINSVLIIDLPAEQKSELPEPYFYFLNIENIIDYEYNDNIIKHIVFKQPNNKVAVFDEEYYRVFQLDKDGKISGLIIETAHKLGFCPARFFWSTELSSKNPDIKRSPISTQLGNLDWLLFFSISKRHLDLYAPYPIYSAYEADCDFENNETGDYCDGGYLRNKNQQYRVTRNGTVEQCPVCAEKRLAGVGSFIEIPIPKGEDKDLRNPVQITTIDETSLNYNVEEIKRLTKDVFNNSVGYGGDAVEKESINEMQVIASFESKESILKNLKENLESAMKFVDDTICKLRYGDFYIGSSISLGNGFYNNSVQKLYNEFSEAKENGASDIELDAINTQIIQTEHRNNPNELQRLMILKQLEPYRNYNLEDLLKLKDNGLVNEELLAVKINFPTFVDRFERENVNLIEFGTQLSFDKKINIILDKFKEYGKEHRTKEEIQPQ